MTNDEQEKRLRLEEGLRLLLGDAWRGAKGPDPSLRDRNGRLKRSAVKRLAMEILKEQVPTSIGELSFEVGIRRVAIQPLRAGNIGFHSDKTLGEILDGPASVLVVMTEDVCIKVERLKPSRTIQSAVFTANEAVHVLDGKWPCDQNIERICKWVNERKNYPNIPVLPPAERSSGQGQTKKPGSHSESRHQR